MHQNDRRFGARILSGVNAVLVSLYKLFLELHFFIHSRITDPATARDTVVCIGAPISTARPAPRFRGEPLLGPFPEVYAAIKRALAPNGILSPGHYGVGRERVRGAVSVSCG
jgi:hypothetical protein